MDLDKGLEGQSFELNGGRLQLIMLNQSIANQWYNKQIIKNQLKILQYLETGKINDEKVDADLTATQEILNTLISRDYFDKVADIVADPEDPDNPA